MNNELREELKKEEFFDLVLVVSDPEGLDKCPVCECLIFGLIHHEDESWRCPRCYNRFQVSKIVQLVNVDGDFPLEVKLDMEDVCLMVYPNKSPRLAEGGLWQKNDGIYRVDILSFLKALADLELLEAYEWYAGRYPDSACICFTKEEAEELMTVLEIEPDTQVTSAMIRNLEKNQEMALEETDFSVAYHDF